MYNIRGQITENKNKRNGIFYFDFSKVNFFLTFNTIYKKEKYRLIRKFPLFIYFLTITLTRQSGWLQNTERFSLYPGSELN